MTNIDINNLTFLTLMICLAQTGIVGAIIACILLAMVLYD